MTTTEGIDTLIERHPFFQGMPHEAVTLIAGCGRNEVFRPEEYLGREGEIADAFFALRHGRVAIEVNVPGRGPRVVLTLEGGDILGWSWLFPPYRWVYDARAVELTRAVRFDGACLRGKCDSDPSLGYDLMKRFARLFARRLEATRLQLVDIYGNGSQE